jgi:hypothetical protein
VLSTTDFINYCILSDAVLLLTAGTGIALLVKVPELLSSALGDGLHNILNLYELSICYLFISLLLLKSSNISSALQVVNGSTFMPQLHQDFWEYKSTKWRFNMLYFLPNTPYLLVEEMVAHYIFFTKPQHSSKGLKMSLKSVF